MKKTAQYIIIAATLASLTTGCHKDNNNFGMRLVGENIHTTGKAAVDGINISWVNGESIRINGENKTIAIDEEGAYITDVTESSIYRAIYPASINGSAALDGDNVTVTIPSTHVYNSDANGRQLLDIPMAGRSENGSSLYLKHLTAAIMVEITNYYGFAVLVDSIEVRSSDEGTPYQLSGTTTIDLTDANMGITPNSSPTEAQKKVTMTFGDGTHALKIDQGATRRVMVPVLPVGSGNRFSITVGVHKDGNSNVKKAYPKTQRTGGSLPRARMAYANDTVGFLFTIGVGRKVIISQGNLQYQASTNTWRFAANQYDYIGSAAGNNTAAADRATQSAWIDLFGWGTSGWNNGNTYYQPYETGTGGVSTGYGYGPKKGSAYTYSLLGEYAESDWGVHNKISNGCNTKGKWRTMTAGTNYETDSLFTKRATNTSNMPPSVSTSEDAHVRYIKAMIGGTKGIILFPDNYSHPDIFVSSSSNRRYNTVSSTYNFDGFQVSIINWEKMEAEGAVFLPAAGYRTTQTVKNANTNAYYWSSSHNTSQYAQAIKFLDGYYSALATGVNRNYGCSVRLVQDVR